MLFIIGLKKKDRKYYYGSFAILALSVYSYGPSYFFVPFFLGAILVYVVATKKINWKELIGPCVMLLVLVTPMMLFVMINTFDMEQIKIGFITIPKLYASRHTELASVFSEDFIGTFSRNMKASFDIILKGEDGLPWNSISTYGICYNFSLVFLIIGIVVSFAKTDWLKGRFFMNAWGVMAFLTMGIVEPNINRINIVWIPLVYYVAVGIMACVRQSKLIFKTVAVVYLAAFLMFSNKYFTTYQEDIGNYFFESFGDALEAAEEKNTDVVYITNEINAPYMLTLFYKQISPQEYRDTVTFSSQYTAFEQILSFGKYVFYIPENLDQPNAAYIVSNYYAESLDRNMYDVTEFNHYSVVTLKNVG